ncbi:MAG: hypothetical protein KDJ65_06055, partial [Anaerolineae bacterium]|nr:hypothetical protein [Anaerolineae bacterium]
FNLPPSPHKSDWQLVIDTSLPSPLDIRWPEQTINIRPPRKNYLVKARSVVVMFANWDRVKA